MSEEEGRGDGTADGPAGDGSGQPRGGGLWGLWDTVRSTSQTIANIYKEDLLEFSGTITEDTKEVVTTHVSPVVKQTLEKLGSEQEQGEEGSGETPMQSRYGALKSGLLSFFSEYEGQGSIEADGDALLLLSPPQNEAAFSTFLSSFDLESKHETISQMLACDDALRELHTDVVPQRVSYRDFWNRYFFFSQQREEQQQQRSAALEKAKKLAEMDEEVLLEWNDGDDEELIVEDTADVCANGKDAPSGEQDTSGKASPTDGDETRQEGESHEAPPRKLDAKPVSGADGDDEWLLLDADADAKEAEAQTGKEKKEDATTEATGKGDEVSATEAESDAAAEGESDDSWADWE